MIEMIVSYEGDGRKRRVKGKGEGLVHLQKTDTYRKVALPQEEVYEGLVHLQKTDTYRKVALPQEEVYEGLVHLLLFDLLLSSPPSD